MSFCGVYRTHILHIYHHMIVQNSRQLKIIEHLKPSETKTQQKLQENKAQCLPGIQ